MHIRKKYLQLPLVLGVCALTLGVASPACANPTATTYGYVSNGPAVAGPNASLGEVWWRHGGVRLQYDALIGPTQTNTNGFAWRDPATVHNLPPLFPSGSTPRSAPHSRAVQKPNTQANKNTTAPSSTPPATSHKLTVPEK